MNRSQISTIGSAIVLWTLGGATPEQVEAQISFGEPDTYGTPASPSSAAVVDLDANGMADVVITQALESVTSFVGIGGGALLRVGSVYQPGVSLSHIQAADLDGDGDIDLLWLIRDVNAYSVKILRNRGDGRGTIVQSLELSRIPGDLVVGDLSGDGLPELVIVDGYRSSGPASACHVYSNSKGVLNLAQSIALEYIDSRSVVIGDVDGDGDNDLTVLNIHSYDDYYYGWKNYNSKLEFLANDGTGSFARGQELPLPYASELGDGPMPVDLEQGDYDGDGDLDFSVAAINYYRPEPLEVTFIESDVGVTFDVLQPIVFAENGRWGGALRAGDLDVDGDLDLLLTQTAGKNYVIENRSDFSFSPAELDFNPRPLAPPTLGDVNDDGRIDLVYGYLSGLAVSFNTTPFAGPTLEYAPLKRGLPCTQTVSGAAPGESVHFLYTLRHAGNSVGIRQLGGITLDINEPIQMLGSAVADANGVAEFHFTVPPNAPLAEVVLQAVIRRGPGGVDSVKTPFRTARITN